MTLQTTTATVVVLSTSLCLVPVSFPPGLGADLYALVVMS